MISPYLMVLINCIASILVVAGILFYRYVYPKRKINIFILLIIISFVPIISVFRQGVYESGDFVLHSYRVVSFYHSLSDGQFIPSWAAELDAGYGYPMFMFDYYLPNYILSLFHFVGIPFILSLKFYLALTYIFSGVFFYIWFKTISNNKFAAFTGAIFYLFAPYHLIDQHFRVSTGEILAFTILPLFFLSIEKLFDKQNLFRIFCVTILFFALALAHPATLIFSSIIVVSYVLLTLLRMKKRRVEIFFSFVLSVIIGMILSSFVILGNTYFSQYTHSEIVNGIIFFRSLPDLLYSPWKFGFLFQGKGDLAFIIGYTQLFTVVAALVFVLQKKIPEKYYAKVIFWLIMFVVLAFLILPYSSFIWKLFPILGFAQFSYRLLLLIAFVTAILAGYASMLIKKNWMIGIICITIFYTILNWGNRGMIPYINDAWIAKNLSYSDGDSSVLHGEGFMTAQPKWWDVSKHLWPTEVPRQHAQILSGNGQIKEFFRNTVTHRYVAYSKTNMIVLENTSYFPGWSIMVDGKKIPIDYENKIYSGRMIFAVPKGLHTIEVHYADLSFFATAKNITLFGTLGIILYMLFWTGKKHRKFFFPSFV